jgi:hypothetical protein
MAGSEATTGPQLISATICYNYLSAFAQSRSNCYNSVLQPIHSMPLHRYYVITTICYSLPSMSMQPLCYSLYVAPLPLHITAYIIRPYNSMVQLIYWALTAYVTAQLLSHYNSILQSTHYVSTTFHGTACI